jgi:hypothetical protein
VYRVTWEGSVIPWHITAGSLNGARAKIRRMRADRRLPDGLRIMPSLAKAA